MNYRNLYVIIVLLSFFSLGVYASQANAATLTIGRVTADNIGMNKRVVRMNDNGILLDNSGMCLEVTVNFTASGLAGERVICCVAPLSPDGYMLSDRMGDAVSLGAINVPSDNYSGKFNIVLPYTWITKGDKMNIKSLNLGVSLICPDEENVSAEKSVALTENDIHIDGRNLGGKLMTDMFGSPLDMLGGLFGGGDVEATHDCPACDGTGVCQHCDGDAYFSPSVCRKCSSDPGICRRCKGTGTITVQYDIY